MSVKITGMDKITRDLESRYGKAAMQSKVDRALRAGAEVFVKELKSQFETFKDTGASIEEMTITEPYDLSGARTITVKWVGPKKRYSLIHLNEFGTIKNPSPRGKGAIARALNNSRLAYRKALRDSLKGGV